MVKASNLGRAAEGTTTYVLDIHGARPFPIHAGSLLYSINQCILFSVTDQDSNQDPSDPYVFGPPGSESGAISQRYESGSGSVSDPSIIKQK